MTLFVNRVIRSGPDAPDRLVRPRGCRVALGIATLLVAAAPALGAPWQPAHDDEVVASVPARSSALRAVAALRREAPADLPRALHAARAAIDVARRDGDPRALGQAQAALSPWWAQDDPPPAVRLMRAVVRQAQHAFDVALEDLDALLREGLTVPLELQAQARLTRASVLQVQGRFDAAWRDCEALSGAAFAPLGSAVSVPAAACRADLAGLQGRMAEAEVALRQLARQAPPGYQGWLALLRGELAERRGDAAAGEWYRLAAAADPGAYPLAAWSDWLLAEGRAREVATLLEGRDDADALLLRLALARQALGDPRAPASAALLRERFAAARERGEGLLHAREEARFALEIERDAARALALAAANWTVQKEPADARVFVAAAAAAGQPEAADVVRAHLRRTGGRDARLTGGAS